MMLHTNVGELLLLFNTFTCVWSSGGQANRSLQTKEGQTWAKLDLQLSPADDHRPGLPVAGEFWRWSLESPGTATLCSQSSTSTQETCSPRTRCLLLPGLAIKAWRVSPGSAREPDSPEADRNLTAPESRAGRTGDPPDWCSFYRDWGGRHYEENW